MDFQATLDDILSRLEGALRTSGGEIPRGLVAELQDFSKQAVAALNDSQASTTDLQSQIDTLTAAASKGSKAGS